MGEIMRVTDLNGRKHGLPNGGVMGFGRPNHAPRLRGDPAMCRAVVVDTRLCMSIVEIGAPGVLVGRVVAQKVSDISKRPLNRDENSQHNGRDDRNRRIA